MNTQWADWVAVGLAVALALTWLGFRLRRQWRKQKDLPPGSIGCDAGCENCPFSKNCTSQNPPD
ncbi:MAG: FeoB-associated Cys-rich membrane protein [Kiritimatiellae bacterium]|nr:FeoB-associated Cys-rich membrane protein [Kiritimatiellia bacterium]MDD4342201.1 FeoB-associated Cys-rich membrane protein [Kiritimatiellia bacterium]MDY0149893.1 FeoB-associated Cys-rich membrane protein [Kiritimatiellia bacterium]